MTKRDELKKNLEDILRYEGHIVDDWGNMLRDAKEMVENALEKKKNNKFLQDLLFHIDAAIDTECALSDIKGLLECVNNPNALDKEVRKYEKEIKESILFCESIIGSYIEEGKKPDDFEEVVE